jgi:hypothetical protein
LATRKRSDKAASKDVSSDTPETDSQDSIPPEIGSDDISTVVNKDAAKDVDVPDGAAEFDDSIEARDDGPTEDSLIEAETPEPVTEDSPTESETENWSQDALVPVPMQPARPSTLALFIGGVVAALLGFLAARAEVLDPLLPPGMRAKVVDEAVLEKLDATERRLTQLEATVAALPEPQPPAQAPEPVDLTAIDDQLLTLTARLDTLVARPPVEAEVPTEALDAALADLRKTAEAQQAEIDRLLADARLVREDAQASANATLARAAITRIQSAVDSGAPFTAALSDLEQTGQTEIPEELRNVAETGVTPLATLQSEIPDAARSALAAARLQDNGGGLGSFFQRQLGLRSIEPREGSDPDAVLSRIEAAVRAGRLGDALAEAETLPEGARAALGPWIEQARMRHDAVTAANVLAERLSAL